MSAPRFRLARRVVSIRRTIGDIGITSVAWIDALVSQYDAVLPADVGDMIVVDLSTRAGNEAVQMFLDPWTIVGTAATNAFSAGGISGIGNPGWVCDASVYSSVSGATHRVLTTDDLFNGLVRVRLRARVASSGTKTLYASGVPLLMVVENKGARYEP